MLEALLLVARPPTSLVRHRPAVCCAPSEEAPVGVHLGVVCDKTLNPITGWRYMRKGSAPSYDLCQDAFDQLTPEEQLSFDRIAPPLTPRRAAIGLGAVVAALNIASLLTPKRMPGPDPLDYDDLVELPPLSPAEEIVAFFFKPKIPATQRERRPLLSRAGFLRPATAVEPLLDGFDLSEAGRAEAECDDACKQRIADRRAIYQQSKTTTKRQDMFDLSRQRAALYNTTYQGADCVPGLPCL